MPRCVGSKPDGTACERIVGASQSYCYSHDPARQADRKRSASKGGKRGGRGRPQQELSGIKDRLRAMVEDVRARRMDRADAAVCGQLYNTLIRAVSVELKAREQLELIERLEALEGSIERQKNQGGGRRWGA